MRCILPFGRILTTALLLNLACVNSDFDEPLVNCVESVDNTISYSELEQLVQDDVIQIQEDVFIEGYVVSSDKAGNFFNILYIQDHPSIPSQGVQLEIELRESHLFYEEGSKVRIGVKGLFLGKSDGQLKLGGTFSAFGNISVGRLPTLKIREHIFKLCDSEDIQPVTATIQELAQLPSGILVQLENIEFTDEELGNSYAEPQEETIRILQNCEEIPLEMVNSGFADFQADIVPQSNGTITGVLMKDGDKVHK